VKALAVVRGVLLMDGLVAVLLLLSLVQFVATLPDEGDFVADYLVDHPAQGRLLVLIPVLGAALGFRLFLDVLPAVAFSISRALVALERSIGGFRCNLDQFWTLNFLSFAYGDKQTNDQN